MMSICSDAQGRVTGVCPDNLTGGIGWEWIETDLTPATELCNAESVALYKLVDGIVSARTVEEIAADMPASTGEPKQTTDEKLNELAEQVNDAMLAIMFLSIE